MTTQQEMRVDDAFWVYLCAIVKVWKEKDRKSIPERTYLSFYDWISNKGVGP